MLFRQEFAKAATTWVGQVKAMKKISKPEEKKGGFSGYNPEIIKPAVGGGY